MCSTWAEVLKTFEIQQYIGFFVIAGLLELLTACQTREYQTRNARLLERRNNI